MEIQEPTPTTTDTVGLPLRETVQPMATDQKDDDRAIGEQEYPTFQLSLSWRRRQRIGYPTIGITAVTA